MSTTWRRILIAGGFAIGVAIVALLAVIAYALLTGDDDGSGAEVAHIMPTATASPTGTPTPRATLTPTATPTPTPTPEPTEEPPPPPPVEEQPPPAQQQAPPSIEEPPSVTQSPSSGQEQGEDFAAIDVSLSINCAYWWRDASLYLLEMWAQWRTGEDYGDAQALFDSNMSRVNDYCISPWSVVPVPDASTNLSSLCDQSRTYIGWLDSQIAEAQQTESAAGLDPGTITWVDEALRAYLQEFVDSNCQ